MTSRAPRGCGGRPGFTLIEVLLALAVLSISLVTLLGLQVASIGLVDHAQRLTRATLIAQSRMAETLGGRDFSLGSDYGSVEDDARDVTWQWETTIEEVRVPVLEEADVKGMLQVTVRVRWADGARRREVVLASYVEAAEK